MLLAPDYGDFGFAWTPKKDGREGEAYGVTSSKNI